jgi:2,5-furandicarboxylate decarboxylase 1
VWHDFRGFLEHLESKGELLRLDKEVDPRFEVTAYIRKSCDVEGPAFLFEKVKGFDGWRFGAALYAARRRIAIGMNCKDDREVLAKYSNAVLNPIEPKIVGDGPCQEVVMKGDQVDLTKIPLATHSERDPGPFVTSAVEIAKHPDTGTRLLGIHRLQLRGKDELAFWGPAEKRIGRAFLRSQDLGKPLDVAVVLGNEPAVDLASQAKVEHGADKMAIAGGITGAPISLVPCKTVALEVPRGAEVVIEGRMMPNTLRLEGPFGEVTGVYSGTTMAPSIKVTAITMRSHPIMHTVLAGIAPSENGNMVVPAMLEAIHRVSKQACPEIAAVNVTGNSYFTCLVSIKKRHEGEPWNVISAVLGGIYQTKYCYVFDDDIDLFEPTNVQWAVETRMQPHKDAHIFPVMVGAPLDPSAPIPRHTSKMGFDCTIPLNADRKKFEKVRVPGADEVTW